jgi:hypothetical protein
MRPYAKGRRVKGSAGVMAVVLAEIVAGAAALLWCVPLWREVKRGFFTLMGAILLVLSLLMLLSSSSGVVAGDVWGRWSVRLGIVTVVVIAIGTALLAARRHAAGRVLGMLGAAVATSVLGALAGAGRQRPALGAFQLVAGALFLGSVVDGLMLGHWYLTDRGLPREPINRYTNVMLGAVGMEAVAVVSGGFSGTGSTQAFNPLLTAGALAPWIALGMVGATGLVAVMTRLALRGARASAVQSATGFYYLAVVTAVTAELAVKTRFFAG